MSLFSRRLGSRARRRFGSYDLNGLPFCPLQKLIVLCRLGTRLAALSEHAGSLIADRHMKQDSSECDSTMLLRAPRESFQAPVEMQWERITKADIAGRDRSKTGLVGCGPD
jgi:hypothetical protein